MAPRSCAGSSVAAATRLALQLPDVDHALQQFGVAGADILGALLMGHPYQSWWTGSDLSIEESRRLVPHQNATTMQVAISVVGAVMWMIENPVKGVCVPDAAACNLAGLTVGDGELAVIAIAGQASGAHRVHRALCSHRGHKRLCIVRKRSHCPRAKRPRCEQRGEIGEEPRTAG